MSVISPINLATNAPELELRTSNTDFGGLVEYRTTLGDDLGHMTAYFDPTTDIFDIDWFDTAMPRQGHGRLLLQHAIELASGAEAELITSTAVTRESLDSMTKVFGHTALTVEDRGDYLKRNTRAYLNYYL